LLLAPQLESMYTPDVPVGDGSDADYALVKKLAKLATTQYNSRIHAVLKVSPKQAYMQRTTVRESNTVVDNINEHLDLQHTQYIGRLERHLAYKASKVPITYFIEGEAVVVLTYNAHAKRSSQKAKKIVGIAKVVEVLANDRYHVQWLFNGNPPYAIKGKRSEKSYPHYCLKKVAKHMSLER
jgi:hypothetical protein